MWAVVIVGPVIVVPVTIGAPLMTLGIVPSVGFGVASLPLITQSLFGFLRLVAFPAVRANFRAVVVMGFFHSALATRASILGV